MHVLLFQAPILPLTIEDQYRAQVGFLIVTPMHVCYKFRQKISSVTLIFGYLLTTTSRLIQNRYNAKDILELSRHDLCSQVSHCGIIVTQASCRERERRLSVSC